MVGAVAPGALWREAALNFQPSWFSVATGTAALAATVAGFPHAFAGQLELGFVFWWIACVTFLAFTALTIAKAVRFTPRALLLHPTQSMFLGLWPLALTALTAGLPTFWARWFDAAAVTTAALVLWALCFAAAMVFSLLLPHIIFTQQKHGWKDLTAIWLLPVIPGIYAADTGGLIAQQEACSPGTASHLFFMGCYLWGMSMMASLMVLTLYMGRLAVHRLPPKELIVSCFLPVAPLAKGALAVIALGDVAAREVAGETVVPFGLFFKEWGAFVAIALWGGATWWLVLAVAAVCTTIRQLPFSMGWWGFVFPTATYASACVQLSEFGRLNGFGLAGSIFSVLALLLWLVIAAITVVRLVAHVRGTQALEGPDLGLLAREEEAVSRAAQQLRCNDSAVEEAGSGTNARLSGHCSCCGQAAAPP